jgi:hypothetical protein
MLKSITTEILFVHLQTRRDYVDYQCYTEPMFVIQQVVENDEEITR